jgi:hypothetical protein
MRKEIVSSTAMREGIEALRHMTSGSSRISTVTSSANRAGRITNSSSSGVSPGASRLTRRGASRNARAAAHWRSPMTLTSGFEHPRTS